MEDGTGVSANLFNPKPNLYTQPQTPFQTHTLASSLDPKTLKPSIMNPERQVLDPAR